ncbi:MAG: DNA/RNA non-specific endonuclease [Bacteroidaceae bacterium]
MKKILMVFALCGLFLACSDEDVHPGGGEVVNDNANGVVAQGVSENAEANFASLARRLEIPKLKNGNDLFVVHVLPDGRINYCMEYDCDLLASRWTAFQWYNGFSSNDNNWNRNAWKSGTTFNGYGGNGDPFQPDPIIPSAYQTTLADHTSSGHDRGHMLGSADRLNSKEANGQSFYLSNIHPQLAGFNQTGIWYNLEERLRSQYDKDSFRDTLYVVKGGTIGESQYSLCSGKGRALPVPKYFFMALLCKNPESRGGGYKAIAFWMEHKANSDTNFRSYAISIDELEQRTEIDFFCNLPDDIEDKVESTLSLASWGIN